VSDSEDSINRARARRTVSFAIRSLAALVTREEADDSRRQNSVNVTPVDGRSLAESVRGRTTLFRQARSPRSIVVPGSPRAERLDGLTQLSNPAEPQTLTMVFAIARDERVTLSIRSWPRDDLGREVERILGSFEIIGP
jgi:hypothetical protein